MKTVKRIETAPVRETKKALKWILRSGVGATFISGLVALIISLQSNTIDLRFFAYGFLILVLNATFNLADYYLHESEKGVK